MGRRRGRCEANEPDEVKESEGISHDWDEDVDKADGVKSFFACYLLCSLSPRRKGHTYIGFTVNPQRRIKQHNGEKTCGAWRTKRGRPWEMVLCIYGFPSNVSALQFEWAWQHPRESLAVRKAASSFKSLSGVANKIKLAYTMLTLSSWENLKLTVNYFSTKYTRHTAGCTRLPNQMTVNICCMDELPCYAEGQVFGYSNDDEKEDDGEEDINKYAEEIRNIRHIRNTPSYSLSNYLDSAVDNCRHPLQAKEPDILAEHIKSTKEYYGSSLNCSELDDLTRAPNKVIACRRVSSTSLTPSSCCEGGMELVRQKSTPRISDNEAMADSLRLILEVDVINLCTPSSCITRTKTKRALFDSEIIDLTDSPMVIQL